LCDNDDAVLTVEIGGKTITMSVVDELKVYQSAVAAGDVYTAAEDCVLFGLVITGIPNDAWETVKVTLTSDNTNVSGELAKEDVVLHQTGTKLDVTNYNFEDHHGGVLEGRAAWILKIADASIRDAITNGTYTVKAAINGELYTVKDFYSTNGYVRMGLESAGVTGIRKGDVYTAEAHIYDADGNYLYYTGVYTITSGVWSSDLGQNITLPEGLVNVSNKVKVDDMTSDFKKQWGDGGNKNLFDGKDGTNGTTKIGGDVNGKTLTITFELTEAVTITHYTFVTGSDTNGNATRNPVAWVLYGKDANGEWVELSNLNRDDEALGMLALNSKPFSYAVENPMACTDYKLVITARDNNGKFQMNELHLYTPAE
ncbi:MAG: hypothetical protein J6S34_04510, partial [Clostridia bacterium]|nr:hypothetical protein [Clostridia bacterium]